MTIHTLLFRTLILSTLCFSVQANEPHKNPVLNTQNSALKEALLNGTPTADIRYFYEHASQNGLANKANASTLRTRLGYITGAYHNFKLGFAVENTTNIGAERYNNGYNGKTTYPLVPDGEDNLLDTLYLNYGGFEKTNITLGRQVINLDNQRFIGGVEWRQHRQTFDAVSINTQIIDKSNLFYAYASQVNRVAGPNSHVGAYNSDSHLINGSYEFNPALKLATYGYLLNFDDAITASSQTYGVRLTGKYPLNETVNLLYTGEFANQADYGHNPSNIDENYYLIEPAVNWNGWTAKLGYEVLGGNGTTAFQMPLATLHAFNGWADKFLTTPNNGLEDIYTSVNYKIPFGNDWVKGTDFTVSYHDFKSNYNNTDYGTEWNALTSQTFKQRYVVGLKFADYQADGFATDTSKAWVWLAYKY